MVDITIPSKATLNFKMSMELVNCQKFIVMFSEMGFQSSYQPELLCFKNQV